MFLLKFSRLAMKTSAIYRKAKDATDRVLCRGARPSTAMVLRQSCDLQNVFLSLTTDSPFRFSLFFSI
jgi:hypothetical protein